MSDNSSKVGGGGITLGALIAFVLSWTTNHSILLGIIHSIFGWIYVVYWAFTYSK